jgi:MFS superfamily sulfate permease-like transporter
MNPSSKSYFATLKSDLPAAVVVFFVALPLCLGIALASGAPLISGVIAGIVGGIVVGSLSGSPLGVSGPAAGLAVIVLTAIQDLGSFEIFLVAVILAGLIQVALGFLRAGAVGYYFPSSVISGMLAGIGIIIFLKQVPHALGYDRDPEGDFSFKQLDGETTFSELLQALDVLSGGPVIIAAVSLVILLSWGHPLIKGNKILSLVPGPLVAVVTGIIMHLGFRDSASLQLTTEQHVSLPASDGIAGIADLLTFPDFSALSMGAVYSTAVLIAVVGSLETLLCVEATDKLDPEKRVTPTNRELKAQGMGNVVSGLIGGLPITQVIVRSSANIQAGGKTKVSAILHGVLLVVSVLALPTVMNLIPLATLAAILLIVGYKLAKPSLFKKMFNEGPGQFIPFAATIAGIVFTDLLIGVGIGLAIAIIGLLKENYQIPHQVERGEQECGESVRIVLAQHVSFLNKASLLHSLNTIPDESNVEIDGTDAIYVHADVVEIIDNFAIAAKSKGIDVSILGLDHHQKGHPTSGADFTVTLPPKP